MSFFANIGKVASNLKIHDWNAELDEEQEGSCVISFRLSNVIGVKYFVAGFNAVKAAIGDSTGFNGVGLAAYFVNAAASLYSLLKASKGK